jgi:hypothetical protein
VGEVEKKSLFVLIIISLILVSFVSAKDLVWIEAPDSIETHKPVELTLHIEDPLIHKYAKNIYIRANGGGVQWIPDGGKEMHYDTEYKGQEEITFIVWGIYDDYYEDNTLNFTVAFYSDEETLRDDFDPTETYQNHYIVSIVTKLIEVLPLTISADFPDYQDCLKEENIQPEGVYGASCRYKGDEEIPGIWSESRTIYRHACIPSDFFIDGNYVGCYYTKRSSLGEYESEWRYASNQSYSWSVQGDGPGSTEGFMRSSYQIQQYQYKTEDEDTENEVKKHLTYLTVDFYQKSGWLDYQGSVTRSMWLEKDEVPGELQSLISDTESFVGSASFNKQGGLDSSKNYKSHYTTFLGEPEQTVEGLYVYGYITDINKNPLSYMKVEIQAKDKTYETITSLNVTVALISSSSFNFKSSNSTL